MGNQTPRYWVRLGSGSELLCEDIGLAPMEMERQNLQPDRVTFEQSRVRGAWVVDIAHDTAIRLYLEQPDTTLVQLFVGRVVSPAEVRGVDQRRRWIQAANVWQFAKEVIFHRGDWTPSRYVAGVASGTTHDDDHRNSDICTLFYGDVALTSTNSFGQVVKTMSTRSQTVTQAVAEVITNLRLLITREGVSEGWGFTLAQNFFGADAIKPSWSKEGPLSFLDWLIKCIQPVPDAFATWDYSALTPTLRVGRYREQTATPVASTAWPITAAASRRALHEELSGVVLCEETIPLPADTELFPVPGYARRSLEEVRPTGAVRGIDRGVRVITLDKPLYSTGEEMMDYIAPGMLQASVSAQVSAAGGAWAWLKPGAVVEMDSLRLNVQTTRHDLLTGVVTAAMGMPRQLGIDDAERLQEWLRRWARRR